MRRARLVPATPLLATPLPAAPVVTVPIVTVLVAAVLLLAVGCSSSGAAGPAYGLPELRRLLVSTSDVDLPGYTSTTPDGEEGGGTATAIRYFTTTGGFGQVGVTLEATHDRAAARAVLSTAVTTALGSLRSVTTSSAVAIGSDGRHIAGRTKGYGALQDSVYFVEGSVAVSVTLSSSTPTQPSGVAARVARVQDARLRKAA